MNVYKSIVITGGSGMLAHDLVHALQKRGYAPVALNRSACDVTNAEQLRDVFEKYKPSLLLNCAAHTGVDLAEDEPDRANAINGEALATIASYCTAHNTRLVHFSTDFVFDGQSACPYRPNDATNPLSAYGRSKLMGEENIKKAANVAWLIIRTSWLFGRHGNCFPRTIEKMARAGRPLRVVNDQFGCPTFTPDLADASLQLLDSESTGVFHVTNSGITSWFQFASAVVEAFGLPADLLPVTTSEWLRMRPKQATRPPFSALDTNRYSSATGRPMRTWTEALTEYCAGFVKKIEVL